MYWGRNAMLVVVLAATVAGIHSLQPSLGEPRAVTAAACYVALANDLTPLLHPGAPDVASSRECVSPAAVSEGHRIVRRPR